MTKTWLAATLAAALFTGCAAIGSGAGALRTPDEHVARANALAADDLKPLLALCQPQPATRISGPVLDAVLKRMWALPAAAPGQAFDNLYFVASGWASAWVLKTSDGLILFDALDNEQQARELVEGGMVRMGLDPAQIKYIVITHGHGDHYGGVPYLAAKYKARVVASEADWQQMGGKLEFDSPMWPAPPARDIAVQQGDTLRLGDATVTFHLTPGHTLGTLSPVIEVRHNGQPHRALLWGGTAFNFGRDIPRLDSYIDATERLRRQARAQSIDVMVSNHQGYDGAVQKLARLREQGRTGANPFVIGTAAVDRSLQVMGECARAQRQRFAAS